MMKFNLFIILIFSVTGITGADFNQAFSLNNALFQNGDNDEFNEIKKHQSFSNSQQSQCDDGDHSRGSCNNITCELDENSENKAISRLTEFCLNSLKDKSTSQPDTTTANLQVVKIVDCEDNTESTEFCDQVEDSITPEQFILSIAGNNPSPAQFNGSPDGTNVTIYSGSYTITDTATPTVAQEIHNIVCQPEFNDGYSLTGPIPSFGDDCSQFSSSTGGGAISAGQSKICGIINTFTIDYSFGGACPPV